MKRLIHCLALGVFLCLAACGSPPGFDRGDMRGNTDASGAAAQENNPLRITVVDVGQGDAILLEAPDGRAILVDAGPPGAGVQRVLPLLIARHIASLDAVFVTHFHEDHVGGLAEVLAGPDGIAGTIDDVTITGGLYARDTRLAPGACPAGDTCSFAAVPEHTAYAGDRLQFGAVDLEVVASGGVLADGTSVPPGDPPDENALGIALLIRFHGFRMLLEADVTGGGGDPPYETPDLETPLAPLVGHIDLLKVAHHGSDSSTNQAFLDTVSPKAAIISVGDGNDYHHPSDTVIERLLAAGVAIYQTERGALAREDPIVANGNITIEVDGQGIAHITAE